MRILLDECLPKRLKRDLLGLAESQFGVFLTVDRNLALQQDVGKFRVAVVVMVAKGNTHADLQPLIADVIAVRGATTPGQVVRVSGREEG